MSINKIQFQKGMSLVEFLKVFPNEPSCCAFLRKQKWPEGFRCRRCSHNKSSCQQKGIREIHECLSCFYQESLICNTLFEHTRLPLRTWFLAIQLLTQAKTCMSAMELHRHLNINIKTAQLLKHKIMQTLTDAEEKRILKGRIECKEAYLGKTFKATKKTPFLENKVPFITAVQTDRLHHPQKIVLTALPQLSREQLKSWGEKHVDSHAFLISNQQEFFKGVDSVCKHQSCAMREVNFAQPDINFKWVNTVLFNIKAAFTGAIHAFNFRKYAHRYLGNMQFRFNHRFDLKDGFYEVLRYAVASHAKPRKALFSDLSG
ncbi:MAG: IS1595 family transposase [Lentisphaeraceae bacterium]|nr:IS1595 family transposase [Lentisphaeraceae bacterium]